MPDSSDLSGTDPNDPNDFLHVTQITYDPPDIKVTWTGVAGKTYDVSVSLDAINSGSVSWCGKGSSDQGSMTIWPGESAPEYTRTPSSHKPT